MLLLPSFWKLSVKLLDEDVCCKGVCKGLGISWGGLMWVDGGGELLRESLRLPSFLPSFLNLVPTCTSFFPFGIMGIIACKNKIPYLSED
jgi:hypothetical protein